MCYWEDKADVWISNLIKGDLNETIPTKKKKGKYEKQIFKK